MMALLVLYARATGRTYDALRALLLAGCAMVLMNPYVLGFDPGFQFSFLATFGLIVLGPYLDRLFTYVPTHWGVREYVTATIATQIAVAPLLLYSIGAVSVIALVANVLILIAVPLAMLLVFLAGIIGLAAPGAYVLAYPAYLALEYILSMAEFLSRVPFAEIAVPPFPFLYVGVSYTILAAALWYLSVRSKTTHGPKGPQAVLTAPS
jgi:competence protein ComEC